MTRTLLATLAAGLLLVTPAHGQERATGPILLSAVSVTRTNLAFGPAGRKADRTEQRWSLRDRFGRTVGQLYLSCRWVTAFNRFCGADMEMPLGQVTLAGVSPTAFFFEYAVTGGTARYVGVQGDAQFTVTGARRMIVSVTLS